MSQYKFFLTTLLVACLLPCIATPTSTALSNHLPVTEAPVVSAVAPIFPRLAMAARIGGEVKVNVRVNGEGKVKSADAVGGHPLLRRAAKEAALL